MSNFAVAYPRDRNNFRRARTLRQTKRAPLRALRPWSEVPVAVAGIPLQATTGHPTHIKRTQLAILFALAVSLHFAAAWYITTQSAERDVRVAKHELNIELVRPPEPPKPEPPKPEPAKPTPPKPQQAQILPDIRQSDPLPSTVGEQMEAPVAVAPVVAAVPEPDLPTTAPVGRAGYLNNPPPDYPAQAVRQNWQGTVLLRVHVLSSGKVESVEVKQSSGKKILDDEAIRTVKRWLFTPSKRGDVAVDGWATVPIEFVLDA
jgi:protein TonB